MLKRTGVELWELEHSIEFHWNKPDGLYYSGPFNSPELAAAYFELRFVRNDKEASHLVPRTYDSKIDRKLWNEEAPKLNLSLTLADIKKVLL